MGEQAVQRKKAESGLDLGRRRCREENVLCFFFIPTLGRRERGVWGGESWVFPFVCLFVFYIDYFIN